MMPVSPDSPEPLRTALLDMERLVQAFKKNVGYVAPEMMDLHWAQLQMDLAENVTTLYENMKDA